MNGEGIGTMMRQLGATARERLSGFLFISPWLVGFIAFYAGPMLFSFAVSFTNWDFFKNMTFVGLRNYFRILSPDEYALPGLLKTFLFVGCEVPLQLAGALAIAQLLTRKLRGVNLARSLVYLPAVISGPAGGLIWRFMLGKQTGIFNYFLSFFGVAPIPWIDDPHYALFSVISIGLWAVGQPMILFLAALQSVPAVFYEAAEVDGASAARKFFRITLPMISPTILLNVIIIMINQFQMLAPLIVITSGGPAKATYLYSYVEYDNAFRFMKMGYASSLSWFMFIIMLVVTLLLFRSSRRWVYSYSERGDIL
jgi:multiple sugar transport system permease protein